MSIDKLRPDLASASSLIGAGVGATDISSTALPSDVERFQLALNAPSATEPATSFAGPQPVPMSAAEAMVRRASAAAMSADSPPTLGAAILAKLQSTSNEVSSTWETVSRTLASPELTMGQALEVQLQLLKTTIQFDLSGKLITKAAQNLEQIVKTQ